MRKPLVLALLLFLCSPAPAAPQGASLQVSPVRLELAPGQGAAKIVLGNTGSDVVTAQVRVMRWVQRDGKDQLLPTRDVVASPPLVELSPGKQNVVRIVRTTKAAASTEEAYRLLVDQLPPPAGASGNVLNFRVRYSIPVFFRSKTASAPQLDWQVETTKQRTVLEVDNAGGSYLRLSRLAIRAANGKSMELAPGLAGYVLAGSRVRLEFRGGLGGLKPGQTVTVMADGNENPIKAQAEVR